MGKWQEMLATGDMVDFEKVREHSADLLKEMLDEAGEVRGAKAELAIRLGITPPVLSNILNQKRNRKIPVAVLKKLMARLQKKAEKVEPEKPVEVVVPA